MAKTTSPAVESGDRFINLSLHSDDIRHRKLAYAQVKVAALTVPDIADALERFSTFIGSPQGRLGMAQQILAGIKEKQQ